MNLAEVKYILDSVDLELLNVKGQRPPTSSYYHYQNLQELKGVINRLSYISSLKDYTDVLINSELYAVRSAVDSSIAISEKSFELVDESLHYLFNKSTTIHNFLNENLPIDKENSIRIKLPPDAKDFESLAKVMNDLKLAISIPLADEDTGGRVLIEHAEPGSVWLFVVLFTKKAMRLVAEMSWSAIVLLNKKTENDFVIQQVRDYELNNDLKNVLLDAQKRLLNTLVEAEAQGIHNRINDGNSAFDNEAQARLMNSISTLSDLFHRGAEIRPSLSVKEDVANLFPKSNLTHLIESRNKQLPEGKDDKESSGE